MAQNPSATSGAKSDSLSPAGATPHMSLRSLTFAVPENLNDQSPVTAPIRDTRICEAPVPELMNLSRSPRTSPKRGRHARAIALRLDGYKPNQNRRNYRRKSDRSPGRLFLLLETHRSRVPKNQRILDEIGHSEI